MLNDARGTTLLVSDESNNDFRLLTVSHERSVEFDSTILSRTRNTNAVNPSCPMVALIATRTGNNGILWYAINAAFRTIWSSLNVSSVEIPTSENACASHALICSG